MLKNCIVVIPDIHGHATHDQKAVELMHHAVRKLSESYPVCDIVQLGDLCDGAELSSHPQTNVYEPAPSWESELDWAVNEFWDRLKDDVPGANLHFIEGNHEARMHKKMANALGRGRLTVEAYEAMNACNRFEQEGIDCIRYGEGTVQESILELEGVVFTHGWSFAIHAAKNHLDKTFSSRNIVFGHTHRIASYTRRDPFTGKQVWSWSFGTLSKVQQYYHKATPTDHAHGFGMLLVAESGEVSPMPIPIHSTTQGKYTCVLPTGTVLKI